MQASIASDSPSNAKGIASTGGVCTDNPVFI